MTLREWQDFARDAEVMHTAPEDQRRRTMRDPRTDPRPGDGLRKGKRERHVLAGPPFQPCEIRYAISQNGLLQHGCWITTWKDWARDAEVIHIAPEEKTDA